MVYAGFEAQNMNWNIKVAEERLFIQGLKQVILSMQRLKLVRKIFPSRHKRLEDVFRTSWKGRDVLRPNKMSSRRLKKDVGFTTCWRRLIYVVLKTTNLRRLEDVCFTTSSGRLVYNVLKTSDLHRLEDVRFAMSWKRLIYDVWFTTSWRRPIYVILKKSNLRRLEDV